MIMTDVQTNEIAPEVLSVGKSARAFVLGFQILGLLGGVAFIALGVWLAFVNEPVCGVDTQTQVKSCFSHGSVLIGLMSIALGSLFVVPAALPYIPNAHVQSFLQRRRDNIQQQVSEHQSRRDARFLARVHAVQADIAGLSEANGDVVRKYLLAVTDLLRELTSGQEQLAQCRRAVRIVKGELGDVILPSVNYIAAHHQLQVEIDFFKAISDALEAGDTEKLKSLFAVMRTEEAGRAEEYQHRNDRNVDWG